MNLYLRVAPELFLKMLIVGGIERVYEMGLNFRNDSVDMTHNPEFNLCEIYMGYADCYDLIEITEKFISSLVFNLFGTYKIKYHPEGQENPEKIWEIDFTPPFKRFSLIKDLEACCGVQFPPIPSTDSEDIRQFFDDLCVKFDVDCSAPRTTARLIDKVS